MLTGPRRPAGRLGGAHLALELGVPREQVGAGLPEGEVAPRGLAEQVGVLRALVTRQHAGLVGASEGGLRALLVRLRRLGNLLGGTLEGAHERPVAMEIGARAREPRLDRPDEILLERVLQLDRTTGVGKLRLEGEPLRLEHLPGVALLGELGA